MKRIFSRRGEQQSFSPREVMYLIGDVNYSYVHLVGGEIILSCRTLKWFANQWTDFLRLHKKALVNISYIHSYQQAQKSVEVSYVVMRDNAELPIARRRVEVVAQALGQISQLNL